jgi:hypothetical protein
MKALLWEALQYDPQTAPQFETKFETEQQFEF